jgi:hypothetical protein
VVRSPLPEESEPRTTGLRTTDYGQFFSLKNQIIGEQQRANRDACVRDVESWPMPRTCVQDDKIDYLNQPGAIGQITGDARQQKRASSEDPIVVSRRAHKIIEDGYRGGDCKHYKEPTPKTPTLLQLTESDSPILGVNEIEEPVNNCSIITKPKRAHGPSLTGLVDHVDAKTGE